MHSLGENLWCRWHTGRLQSDPTGATPLSNQVKPVRPHSLTRREGTPCFERFASQRNDQRKRSVTLISRICVGDMTHEIVWPRP